MAPFNLLIGVFAACSDAILNVPFQSSSLSTQNHESESAKGLISPCRQFLSLKAPFSVPRTGKGHLWSLSGISLKKSKIHAQLCTSDGTAMFAQKAVHESAVWEFKLEVVLKRSPTHQQRAVCTETGGLIQEAALCLGGFVVAWGGRWNYHGCDRWSDLAHEGVSSGRCQPAE